MTRSNCRRMLFVLLMATVAGAGEPAPDVAAFPVQPADLNSDGWLNVRDFGASGSKFETTAATTAGSKQITVAERRRLPGRPGRDGVQVQHPLHAHAALGNGRAVPQLEAVGEFRGGARLRRQRRELGDLRARHRAVCLAGVPLERRPRPDLAAARFPSPTTGSRSAAASRCGSTSATGSPATSSPSAPATNW